LRKAGVSLRSVKVGSDPTHGTTAVDVLVSEGFDADRARQVLERFPFRFGVSGVSAGPV
jgi:hypothetical protein